jgi:two-component system, cell cycle response regulator DivK
VRRGADVMQITLLAALSRDAPCYRQAAMAASALDLRGTCTLIVEDNDDAREMMRQIVASFGSDVRVARDGYEALRLVQAARPDLIFCDLRMPGLDGWRFVEHLRETPRLCRIPVIAVSALGAEADLMNTWRAGFNGHLVKPVDYTVIATQLVRAFWAHGRSQPERPPIHWD